MASNSVNNKKTHTPITEMKSSEVKDYFLETKHYVNFELPPYFNFDDVLLCTNVHLKKKSLANVCKANKKNQIQYPCHYSDVNHIILSNKDGGFAWRPMQIMHPVLYVDLVNTITKDVAWNQIKDFFKEREKSLVECISIPLKSHISESNKAVQVTNWWDKIEQESLRKALDYKFMFQTDISNCYPSIYTHSFEWAFCPGGRLEVKLERAKGNKLKNLGTEIDVRVRNMNQGQTIGIPQGSALMDFLAEIVLGATDIELTNKINETFSRGERFAIMRYRDDYRIFSDEHQVGHSIMKILNSVLYAWGMKMNAGKTSETSDIIAASIKSEKMEEIYTAPIRHSYQKAAMRIFLLSKKYPNAGLVAKNLTDYFDSIQGRRFRRSSEKIDYEVLVAIITMVAYYSPKYMPQVASIISRLIENSQEKLDRKTILEKIVKKFGNVPNTEFIDLWLQRITSADDIKRHAFSSPITKVAVGACNNSELWNSEWLNEETKNIIDLIEVSELSKKIDEGTFSPLVDREEFELYKSSYPE